MERRVGTVSRGIRTPIIREGDDLAAIVTDSVLEAGVSENFSIGDNDIIALTESIVARAQGNYLHIDAIAKDVENKFGDGTLGVIFPILSRNRFSVCLRGIAQGVKKVVLMLSYPSDEVGNELITVDQLDDSGVNPYSDVLSLSEFRAHFGETIHPFTGIDYISYYAEIIQEAGAEVEIIFSNNCRAILDYTKNV
ncbi:MAG: F420-0--gamma-glutamyl ligase, partial [Erysipelothrix sp.]|nr:F420-0--gamma-glutamyl ligase [Erysipelothrix sp.]